jgi:hypothetical protein
MAEEIDAGKDSISVTIGVFSGRPNPEFRLSGNVVNKLAELAGSAIGKEPIEEPPPAKLGNYYGFLVQTPSLLATHLHIPTAFRLYSDVLTESMERKERHWRDVANAEQFLIEQAFELGYGEFLESAGVEIRGKLAPH